MTTYNLVGSPSIVTPQSTVRGIRALNEDLIDNSPIIDDKGNLSMLGDISANKITYNSLEPPIKGISTTAQYFIPAQGDVTMYSSPTITDKLPSAGYEMLLLSNGWLGYQNPISEPVTTASNDNTTISTRNGGMGYVVHSSGQIISYSLNFAEESRTITQPGSLNIIVLHGNPQTLPQVGPFNIYGNIIINSGTIISAYEKLQEPINIQAGDIVMIGIKQRIDKNTIGTQVRGAVSASLVMSHS